MKNNLTNRDYTKPRIGLKLNPWQVTGFVDGEGSFAYSISKLKRNNEEGTECRETVNLEFKVTQKNHSEGILLELRDYFGCGTVVIDNRNTETKKYHVTSLSDITTKIIPLPHGA